RPEERKFLGFSISNDGSERRIAPKALDRFKTQIRDMTRRTRGISLPRLIEELARLLRFPRPRVYSRTWKRGSAEDYVRIFGGSGRPGTPASQNCAIMTYPSSTQRSPPDHRQGSGACPDPGPFNKPCATTTSSRSVSLDFMFPTKLNLLEPPGARPVARWCGRGGTVRCPPIPIFGADQPYLAIDECGRFPTAAVRNIRRD